MAKATRRDTKAKTPKSPMKPVQVTLGDLIAAAYDAAGTLKGVARVLSSPGLVAATQRRIVLV